MKKLAIWAMIIAWLLAAFAMAESGGYAGDMVVVNCDSWVSLRAEPSTASARLKQVPLGATVTDCAWFTQDFVYGCYDGVYGYILGEYLSASTSAALPGALGPDERQTVIYVEGESETVTETRYHSAMGFSIWYNAESLFLNDFSSESDAPSFMLEGLVDIGDAPAYVEFLSPEITGAGGMEFLEQLSAQYGIGDLTEIEMGRTEEGVAYGRRSGMNGGAVESFWLVMDEEHELQVIAQYPIEIAEGYEPMVKRIVESVAFD